MTARPFVVALTGGIASGKTAVSERFAALGVPVIDTDVIAHELVRKGSPLLQEIAERFGTMVLLESGELDRAAMRRLIFADPDAQARLEALLHPAIMTEVERQLAEHHSGYCVVVIPLLVESGRDAGADRVLVVDVPEPTQRQRLVSRDGGSEEDADAALSAQASRAERLAIADDIIENTGSLADLYDAVEALHREYSVAATRSGDPPEG